MLRVIAFGFISTLCLIGSIYTQYECYRSGATVRLTLFSLTRIRHQVAPWNVGHGAANSLLAMPSSSSVPVESPQKPEPTTRFLQLEGAMEQRVVTSRVPETIAIRYVSDGGNDADDGMSWGTAKHTVYGALVSLPGGGTNTVGSGTVYVGQGASANPTSGAGIWLMGPNDPSYSSPPKGWLKGRGGSTAINIIGVGNATTGPNGHKPRVLLTAGSGADTNHPGIWLSAWASSTYIANFELSYPGRAVVIGECSNHTRTNTCQSSSITLENDSGLLNTAVNINGPCTDITGSSFWIWMRDYGCGGMGYLSSGGIKANKAAAILIDGTGNSGNGLIYVTDANFAQTGIKVIPGSNGASLYARNIILEGDFTHNCSPAVWFTGFSSAMDAVLDNVQGNVDCGRSSMPSIQNDGLPFNQGGGGPTVLNSGASVTGPMTILNAYTPPGVTVTTSPLRSGQVGFFNNYVNGQTNVARRISGVVPVRFGNKAATATASWSYTNLGGRQTLTQGLSDPFGGTGAASIASTSATEELLSMGGCSAYTPAAGDWIVIGTWEKGWAPSNTYLTATCYGYGFPTTSAIYQNKGQITGDGNWEFIWTAFKVASGSATNIGATGRFSSNVTPTLYGPVLYIIPSGTLSDNEVLELASTMNSLDTACAVGSVCNVAGHPVVVSSYGTLSNCKSAVSPAKCDSAPAGSFVLGVGSTTARVNTTAVTADSQILVIEDSSLGAKLGVSCNKTIGRTYMITDRTPGLSFTVSSSFAPTDHPACLSFQLLN
jgi:hypothetical protein